MDYIYSAGKVRECRDCILILTGTSTQSNDVAHLVQYLIREGDCSVAVIERFIGGPLDIKYCPREERLNDLMRTISELIELREIRRIHVIAHSYGAFEIVRLLSGRAFRYCCHIKNVILVNPVGFSGKKRYVRHCLRFLFLFVAKEYGTALNSVLWGNNRDLAFRKCCATSSLLFKSVANLTRTLREIAEIEGETFGTELNELCRSGFNFFFVVNTSDTLIIPRNIMDGVRSLVPVDRLVTFPGNHIDPLLNEEIMGEMYRLLEI